MYLAKEFTPDFDNTMTAIYDDEDISDLPDYGEAIALECEGIAPVEITVGKIIYMEHHIIIYEVLDCVLLEDDSAYK